MKIKLSIIVLAIIICIPACRNYWHTEAEYRAQLLSSSPDQPRATEPPDPAKKPADDPGLDEPKEEHHHEMERPPCPGSIEVTKVLDDDGTAYVFLKEEDFDRMARHLHDMHVYALQLEKELGLEPPEPKPAPEPEPDRGPEPPKSSKPKSKAY